MNDVVKRAASAWHIGRPYGTRSMVVLRLALLILFAAGRRVEIGRMLALSGKGLIGAPMTTARETFDSSIMDAIELLDHVNAINSRPPPPNAEVLKRAGLIMACTAWETYVEDRVEEAVGLWARREQ